MGPRASRPALESCLQDLPGVKIDDKQVQETDEVLGSGAYGEVIVALHNGVRYASKKLHEALVENDEQISPNDPNSPVRKFREECQRMSLLRHPNIVQFIGVYFKPDSPPCLLMELLPVSLAEFLEDKINIEFDRKCFILLDVAKGLLCLHSHSPPIIHRDLTANNVLLTSGLTAKIADFGVARYLPLPTETGGQYMTICPGNLNYMPPEAKKTNALYDTKLDMFSFGHLTVYIANRKWPILLDKSFEDRETGYTEYRTEIERRNDSLEMMIEENLKLRHLAISCLQDDAEKRPIAKDIIEVLTKMIPDTNSKPQMLLDEIDQLKRELQAKIHEVEELKRQLSVYQGGAVLKITGNLPLECKQQADGGISIKLSFQHTFSADTSKVNIETSNQDEHVKVNEASSDIAISDMIHASGSAEAQSVVINGKQQHLIESPTPTQHTKVSTPAMPRSHFETSSLDENLKVTATTNGSAEPRSANVNIKQPDELAATAVPTQHDTSNKVVPPAPVPRARARTRGHVFKTGAATPTERNSSPVKIFPALPANDQRPVPILCSNTVRQLGFDTSNRLDTYLERQRAQTLPRISPIARRNILKDDGGPTEELQALLARRRQWEQKDTT